MDNRDIEFVRGLVRAEGTKLNKRGLDLATGVGEQFAKQRAELREKIAGLRAELSLLRAELLDAPPRAVRLVGGGKNAA